jgi:excisionase family DNA binding protein
MRRVRSFDSQKRLLSQREVARRLGVSRGKTLPKLIARGTLRPVKVGARLKIPAAQVEQLELGGFDVDGPPVPMPRKTSNFRRSLDDGEAIRALKL